jgi:ATP adenylyltransferase
VERQNLWAPWRIGYITSVDKKAEGCFLCHDAEPSAQDDENLVLWRTERCVAVLNRYPYNNGHLLVAPRRHVGTLDDLEGAEMTELMRLTRDAQRALTLSIQPQGFNVGINFGRCAGAGLPGHLHVHIVPRWNGDTNFVSVCSETKVISQSLEACLAQLRETSAEHDLPTDAW